MNQGSQIRPIFYLAILVFFAMIAGQLEVFAEIPMRCAVNNIATETVDENFNDNGGWNYNRERVASHYAIFAAASSDAYEPDDKGKRDFFSIANDSDNLTAKAKAEFDTGWRTVDTRWRTVGRRSFPNGLSYDVYYSDTPEKLSVMVAFRGTDGFFNPDTIANLSWLTQWFNPEDQYRMAGKEFAKIAAQTRIIAKGKPIELIATGHSLGGGLAIHVASLVDCTSAVVFDPTFVTNTLFFAKRKPNIIRIYEDNDAFSRIARLFRFGRINNSQNVTYRLNGIPGDKITVQHSILHLAGAMLRTAIDCEKRGGDCKILSTDNERVAYQLYCVRYHDGKMQSRDPVCKPKENALNFYTGSTN